MSIKRDSFSKRKEYLFLKDFCVGLLNRQGKLLSILEEPVVVKAQILVAGRGKAGGVKPASTPEEASRSPKVCLVLR